MTILKLLKKRKKKRIAIGRNRVRPFSERLEAREMMTVTAVLDFDGEWMSSSQFEISKFELTVKGRTTTLSTIPTRSFIASTNMAQLFWRAVLVEKKGEKGNRHNEEQQP